MIEQFLALVPAAILWPVLLFASLAALVWSSDRFTESAETLGRAVHLPPFIIGVTIVAIGTSLPELVSSVLAVLRDASDIVAGNVVGSNIANLLVVLGIAALLDGHVRIKRRIALVDLPFLLGSTFFVGFVLLDGAVSRIEGIVSLVALGVYLHYTMVSRVGREADETEAQPVDRKVVLRSCALLIATGFLIYLSAEGTVASVIGLAELLGVESAVIAASVVALGTSLPEVSVSIAAARRGNAEMAVGNVLGSNVFNAFGVIGVSALVGVLHVPSPIITFAVPMLVGATLLVYFIIMQQEMTRWEGCLLLLFYFLFIAELFGLA